MKVLVLKNHHMQQILYSVKTFEYNESIVQNILRKTWQEINEEDDYDVN